MKGIAVVGNEEFVLGFQLAGINNAFSLNDANPDNTIAELITNKDIGMIMIDEISKSKLSSEMKIKISESVVPVVLTIGKNGSNEEMRQLIKRSIGVDLWDK